MNPYAPLPVIVVVWFGGVLVAFVFLFLGIAWLNGKVDISGIITDTKLGVITGPTFALLICLLVSSWLMVYLAVIDKMTEGYFYGYLGAWGSIKVLMSKMKTQDEEIHRGDR